MIIALTATIAPTVGSPCSCPGFGALIALIALGVLAFWIVRRH